MTNILVTGGAGFIGSHLCKRLAQEGCNVISLDDYSTGSEENHWPGVQYVRGKTIYIGKLMRAPLITEPPDVIFHLGEYSRVESSFADHEKVKASNERGTDSVIDYWETHRAKLVYAGSSTTFATDHTSSPYTRSKAVNAAHIRAAAEVHGISASITYFYNVYGPRERPADRSGTLIETFRRQRLVGMPLSVVSPGTQRRNFTHVSDIVDGLMLAMKHDGEFAIGAAESYSVLEVAQMFGGPIEMLPERQGNRADSTIDTSAIESLGWRQRHRLADYITTAVSEITAKETA